MSGSCAEWWGATAITQGLVWVGSFFATGIELVKKSTIDYFTPNNQLIMANAIVQEMLRCSEVATLAVN